MQEWEVWIKALLGNSADRFSFYFLHQVHTFSTLPPTVFMYFPLIFRHTVTKYFSWPIANARLQIISPLSIVSALIIYEFTMYINHLPEYATVNGRSHANLIETSYWCRLSRPLWRVSTCHSAIEENFYSLLTSSVSIKCYNTGRLIGHGEAAWCSVVNVQSAHARRLCLDTTLLTAFDCVKRCLVSHWALQQRYLVTSVL